MKEEIIKFIKENWFNVFAVVLKIFFYAFAISLMVAYGLGNLLCTEGSGCWFDLYGQWYGK